VGLDRVDALFERVRGVRVLVVGDLMLDRYVAGSVERISPEAPVPVVRVESERAAVGGAGNVAANVTALGGSCAVVGCVGSDSDGEALVRELSTCGVSCDGVVRALDRPTTVKTRVLAQHQQIVRFDREVDDAAGPELAARLAETVRALAPHCDVLVVQDYDKGVLAPAVVEAVLEVTAARRMPWVVDPKRRSFFSYPGATVFKPNARELGDAIGTAIRPDDSVWMEATRARLGCVYLLVTLGDRGVALQARGAPLVRLPAVARDVYDVSGAGDTVTAAVALTLAAGATAVEASELANHAAAVEVARSGVQTVSPAEIRAHIRDLSPLRRYP
jgi:D-beta-D-heptose 7-phosphate kinase/D-beta-D-heptose 1-phosphate adenosyltransferase